MFPIRNVVTWPSSSAPRFLSPGPLRDASAITWRFRNGHLSNSVSSVPLPSFYLYSLIHTAGIELFVRWQPKFPSQDCSVQRTPVQDRTRPEPRFTFKTCLCLARQRGPSYLPVPMAWCLLAYTCPTGGLDASCGGGGGVI